VRKLSPQNMDDVLESMQVSLDSGWYSSVQRIITDYAHAFQSASDQATTERFGILVQAAREGLSHIQAHGRLSLLDLKHPFNQLLIAQDILRVDELVPLAGSEAS
jgi:hypothetical protein